MGTALPTWRKEFNRSSEDLQTVLRAAAFGQGFLSSDDLWTWLGTARILREEGRGFSLKSIKDLLLEARHSGLALEPGPKVKAQEWKLPPEVVHGLNQEAPRLELYRSLVSAGDQGFWPFVNTWEPRDFLIKSLLLILQAFQIESFPTSEARTKKLLASKDHLRVTLLPFIARPLFPPLLEVLLPLPASHREAKLLQRWVLASLEFAAAWHFAVSFPEVDRLAQLPMDPDSRPDWGDYAALVDFLRGRLPTPPLVTPTQKAYQALGLYLRGNEAEAKDLMDEVLPALDPATPGFGLFALFSVQAFWYLARDWAPLSKFQTWCKTQIPLYLPLGLQVRALLSQRGNAGAWAAYRKAQDPENGGLQAELWEVVASQLLECPYRSELQESYLKIWGEFRTQGLVWPLVEVGSLLTVQGISGPWDLELEKLKAQSGITQSFSTLLSSQDLWKVKLEKLKALAGGPKPKSPVEDSAEVICWILDPLEATVTPVVRKPTRSGRWGASKAISWRTISKKNHPALQPEDLTVLRALRDTPWGPELVTAEALPLLVGHPRIFLSDGLETPITLRARDVALVTQEEKGGIRLTLSDSLEREGSLDFIDEGVYEVLRVPADLKKAAAIIGTGFLVPQGSEKHLGEVLGALAPTLSVESPLLKDHEKTRRVAPDSRPVVQLYPQGAVVVVEIHVRPLGLEGPLLKPAEGARQIHLTKNQEIILTVRDLVEEKALLRTLLSACPSLVEWTGEEVKATILDPGAALDILAELRDLGTGVVVEWPQGQAVKIRSRVNYQNSILTLSQNVDWFELSGEVNLEDKTTLKLKDLLDLLPKATGRFLPVGDEEFLEIEHQLLRQLEQIYRLAQTKAQKLVFGPAALLVSTLLQDSSLVKAKDQDTEKVRERFLQAFGRTYPLPPGLSADLRPYQEEGYQWLSRLTEAGAGACLADDMGLGKTVQTIALLSSRRSLGPSLVIAPASVAPNWMAEILKFTTDLEPVLLSPTDREGRQGQLDALGPGQVLVTTYGLLVTEEEKLQAREWNVLVLDEAQALKNIQTKRTKSVFGIKAKSRVALTGTPLQNRLGELWGLFEILNPGLLGTRSHFRAEYIQPIEEQKSESAKAALKHLIRPFILRRTKNQVLQDLPPKTEITLSLELTPPERGWYNALYLKAGEELAKWRELAAQKKAGDGQIRIQILSWITKLRRTCCHPVLTGGEASLRSAKQEKLLELLGEMGENGHRALVFSQFTDHLALVKPLLDQEGISYEYLDGSVTMKERTARVARFQSGTAPVFLISLGAGGTGLNLTGADYVIHLDPWWNPAIEDQASDRAHRIGQTRPVTVYRLIASDTIEDRIMDLHRKKRALVDALLEGAEASGTMGAEELMELLNPTTGG